MQRDDIIRALKGHEAVPRSHADRLVESSKPSHRAIVSMLRERRCPLCAQPMGDEGANRVSHERCERGGVA